MDHWFKLRSIRNSEMKIQYRVNEEHKKNNNNSQNFRVLHKPMLKRENTQWQL